MPQQAGQGEPTKQFQHSPDFPDNTVEPSKEQSSTANVSDWGLTEEQNQTVVTSIIQPYRTQWSVNRIEQMPQWLKFAEFDRGRQVLGWDPITRTYFDAIAWNRYNNQDVDYSYLEKYVNNITQIVRRNFDAAMARGVPPVIVQPENAENLADATTAKAAQEAVSIIERNNDIKTQLRYEAQILFLWNCWCWLFGSDNVAWYVLLCSSCVTLVPEVSQDEPPGMTIAAEGASRCTPVFVDDEALDRFGNEHIVSVDEPGSLIRAPPKSGRTMLGKLASQRPEASRSGEPEGFEVRCCSFIADYAYLVKQHGSCNVQVMALDSGASCFGRHPSYQAPAGQVLTWLAGRFAGLGSLQKLQKCLPPNSCRATPIISESFSTLQRGQLQEPPGRPLVHRGDPDHRQGLSKGLYAPTVYLGQTLVPQEEFIQTGFTRTLQPELYHARPQASS